MLTPAAFALANRSALGLSAEQVNSLEALVQASGDSSHARMLRVTERMQQRNGSPSGSALATVTSWSGPVNEDGIRAAACDNAQRQAELMIGMIRDRHAVGAVLTAAQQTNLDRIQTELMGRAVSRPE